MQRVTQSIFQLTRCESIFAQPHIEVCATPTFLPETNISVRWSTIILAIADVFSEQLWKLIRFYFWTHCLPAILLLFHPSRSFFRVPFVLVTHCQKHARNEISITFFIPSRTYIHFNFISSLWFFLFFLLSCFTFICSVLIVEIGIGADVVWCWHCTWFLEKITNSTRIVQYLLFVSDSKLYWFFSNIMVYVSICNIYK